MSFFVSRKEELALSSICRGANPDFAISGKATKNAIVRSEVHEISLEVTPCPERNQQHQYETAGDRPGDSQFWILHGLALTRVARNGCPMRGLQYRLNE